VKNVKMKILISSLTLGLMGISGCSTTQKYAGGGAATGAAAGAIIGHQSGDRDKGALLGAVVGGLAGTVLGQKKEAEGTSTGGREQLLIICPNCDSQVDVTGLPSHSKVACPHCKSNFTY
jgi:hypothetical protein